MTRKDEIIHYQNVLKDISHRIDEIQQRAAGVNPDLKEEFSIGVKNLIETKTQLEKNLSDLEFKTIRVNEDTWTASKREFNLSIKHLKEGFQKLFDHLSA